MYCMIPSIIKRFYSNVLEGSVCKKTLDLNGEEIALNQRGEMT